MPKPYDIAVLGATAAGYVAAMLLARKGHRCIVLSAPDTASESPLADWIPRDVVTACLPLRSVRAAGTDAAFREVRFHGEQLDQQAAYRSRPAAGYVLRSEALLSALASAARKAKVARAVLRDLPGVELGESAVVVRARGSARGGADGREFQAGVLLIAHGRPAEVVTELALPVRLVPTGRMTVCGVDIPLGRCRVDKALHLVASPGGRDWLGMYFGARGLVHVRIIASGAEHRAGQGPLGGAPPAESLGEALSQLISRLQRGGLIPPRLDLARAAGAVWHPPGGVALELETHLAKRTLLVGTAGGFASAMTGQTLDASIRSAMVAAEVTDRALSGQGVQEALADYKRQWRNKLADRIRPPGTSIRMLLPIVFSNKPMAARFARAFLYGEHL